MRNLVRQATCIRKCRDNNNKIKYYLLKESGLDGLTFAIIGDELKQMLKARSICVNNLKLSIRGSIIDRNGGCQDEDAWAYLPSWLIKELSKPKHLSFNSKLPKQKLQQLIMKAEMMNCSIKRWDNLVIIESSDQIIINSIGNILLLDDLYDKDDDIITSERGTFKGTEFKSITLKGLNTSYMTSFNSMFRRCKAKRIDLSNINTGNVTEASAMFNDCEAKSIKFSLTNFTNLLDTSYMFQNCKLDSLDLSMWITGNIRLAQYMFCNAEINKLNVQDLINKNAQNLGKMFAGFETQGILDLSSFHVNTEATYITKGMFSGCEAKEIWLQNFYMLPYIDNKYMFAGCDADVYGPEVLRFRCEHYKGTDCRH